MLNLILIDDELDARQLLRGMLDEHTDCQIIGEASNAVQAIALLKNTVADVVFLDIELKDGTGFDVLTALDMPTFSIVFVTAFDEFALKAFQFNAIDYVLKPFSRDDINRVLHKIRQHQHPLNDFQKQLNSLMHSMHRRKHDKLILSTSEGLHFIPLDDIMYLKSEGSYTTVFTIKNERVMVSHNLGTFENLETEDGDFYRIHQSYIVNLKCVRQFLRHEDGEFVVLFDGTKIPVSRGKKGGFLQLITSL